MAGGTAALTATNQKLEETGIAGKLRESGAYMQRNANQAMSAVNSKIDENENLSMAKRQTNEALNQASSYFRNMFGLSQRQPAQAEPSLA